MGKLIHESYGQILAILKTMAESIIIDNNAVNLLTVSVVNYGEVDFVKLPGED